MKKNKINIFKYYENTLKETPIIFSSRGEAKSQGLRNYLKYYIDHCTREELSLFFEIIDAMYKRINNEKKN